ncbi:MAG: helix-turn-helix transcriptional regulator, partial [Acidobacteria bacterium]|nr:helix-turn-helix transcriptional regulator [Acidobacteriota bacterium]
GLISRAKLWAKLGTSKRARERFVESHLDRTLAYQIRALRGDLTQAEFAKKIGIGHANNVSARLENPQYGKHQIRILKKIAAACDMGLVVWFVPFSRMVDWVTATPYVDVGLRPSFYDIAGFENDKLRPPEPQPSVLDSGLSTEMGRLLEMKRRPQRETELGNGPKLEADISAGIGVQ